jgi:hypothetical protein
MMHCPRELLRGGLGFCGEPGAGFGFVAEGFYFADILDEHFEHADDAEGCVGRHEDGSGTEARFGAEVAEQLDNFADLGRSEFDSRSARVYEFGIGKALPLPLLQEMRANAFKGDRAYGDGVHLASVVIYGEDNWHSRSPIERSAMLTRFQGAGYNFYQSLRSPPIDAACGGANERCRFDGVWWVGSGGGVQTARVTGKYGRKPRIKF